MENVENKVVSAPVQTVAPNHEPETNPLDELCNTIDTFRNKLKLALDESTLLIARSRKPCSSRSRKSGTSSSPNAPSNGSKWRFDHIDKTNIQPKGRRPDRFRLFSFMEVK